MSPASRLRLVPSLLFDRFRPVSISWRWLSVVRSGLVFRPWLAWSFRQNRVSVLRICASSWRISLISQELLGQSVANSGLSDAEVLHLAAENGAGCCVFGPDRCSLERFTQHLCNTFGASVAQICRTDGAKGCASRPRSSPVVPGRVPLAFPRTAHPHPRSDG